MNLARCTVKGTDAWVDPAVNNAQFRCEDSKMSQNGGHHAIRRRKLPLESDLPTFFGDPTFFGRYVRYVSYPVSYPIN